MSTETESIPKCIRDRLAALDKEREYLLRSVLPVNIVEVELAGIDASVSVRPWAHTGPGAWADIVVTDGSVIAEARRKLARVGCHLEGAPSEYPEERRVVHVLQGSSFQIALNFMFPQTEGARCKFVEVGKKEVPVYELRCADSE